MLYRIYTLRAFFFKYLFLAYLQACVPRAESKWTVDHRSNVIAIKMPHDCQELGMMWQVFFYVDTTASRFQLLQMNDFMIQLLHERTLM